VRSLWSNHLPSSDIILFIVDAADLGRVGEAREVRDGWLIG